MSTRTADAIILEGIESVRATDPGAAYPLWRSLNPGEKTAVIRRIRYYGILPYSEALRPDDQFGSFVFRSAYGYWID